LNSKRAATDSSITLNNTQTVIEDFVGDYTGYYENNSGFMDLVIEISDFEPTDDSNFYSIEAGFYFEPMDKSSTGKSGAYDMTGQIEIFEDNLGYVWLEGDGWISDKPSANYNMLDLEGWINLNEGIFHGELKRDNKPEFYLDKK